MEILSNYDFIFYGGTAVWRVYGGKRFSFDLDFYYLNNYKGIDILENYFKLKKERITDRGTICITLEKNKINLDIELAPLNENKEYIIGKYQKIDGNFIDVLVLTPEEIIKEKVIAYLNRNKCRDLYDIWILLPKANISKIKDYLRKLLVEFKYPNDVKETEELIVFGKKKIDIDIIFKNIQYYYERKI